uniref:ASCH domain-containing protein n=1 Tax=Candidatus Kentrum sp. UNK TaxID=2126344 RepID=A0A451ARF8_9GAMM|nr:MAG: hypothetical protein BECKUNK1418G_GA0071005_100551 [Candidatus Kentron sp. UNK]VFK68636.1 MAG: hypothetical protein BECKUNK1418H_GA0071006_100451 [Candidatus Kentron sp. UNK]
MPRNMSFFHTADQVRDKSKTVTRRIGWQFLKAGDELNAVEKSQGLKKGEKVRVIHRIRVIRVTRERLYECASHWEARCEGFPGWSGAQFIRYFMDTFKCPVDQEVTRIEFEYMPET